MGDDVRTLAIASISGHYILVYSDGSTYHIVIS